jgi:hypothetical protein
VREFLIVARVGDRSLHAGWLEGPRNWDLALSCFGSQPPAAADQCVAVEHAVGPKWGPLHHFIMEHLSLIRHYRYVMLPDDDLCMTAADLNRFFDLCARHNFAIAQPSLDYRSYFSHPITVRRPFLSYRATDFVEVMMPCFRTDILEEVLPTFLESASGWGLDDMWPQLYQDRDERFAIVDEVSATHTRPVGGELHRGGALRRGPARDYQDLHARGVASVSRRMSQGYTRSGRRVPRLIVRGLGLLSRLVRRPDGLPVFQVEHAGPVA